MLQSTKKLVSTVSRFSVPAAVAGAFVLGASLFVGHGTVNAASPLSDNSVSALTALDHAMETVAARVTPAVVNVSVTSKVTSDVPTGNQMQNLPPPESVLRGNGSLPDGKSAHACLRLRQGRKSRRRSACRRA